MCAIVYSSNFSFKSKLALSLASTKTHPYDPIDRESTIPLVQMVPRHEGAAFRHRKRNRGCSEGSHPICTRRHRASRRLCGMGGHVGGEGLEVVRRKEGNIQRERDTRSKTRARERGKERGWARTT